MATTATPLRSAWASLAGLLPSRADLAAARQFKRRNLLAGVTVGIVALPLALAFGETSGLGARAGLVTAIVAGAVAAIFGGSNLQVSGPTGAMTVVLIPIVHHIGVGGVLMVGLMAGLLLIAAAAARLGRFINYVPAPVIEGFTAGIAVVIALQQVPSALGVKAGEGDSAWRIAWDAAVAYSHAPTVAPVVIALGVAALILAGTRVAPTVPMSLVAIVVVACLVAFTPIDVPVIGSIPAGLPAPSLAFVDLSAVWTLASAALAVATLSALESLLSASVADGMTVGERHDPDRELFGQGLANIASPIFGGIPATAAIARTAVNVRAGASSKVAALSHALVLLVVVSVAGTVVGHIPSAALAGVLIATTIRMVEVGSVMAMARSTKRDALALGATFALTVAFDLVTAVMVGIGIAVALGLRAVARSVRLERVPLEAGEHSEEEHALLEQHVVAYRLDGPLFFAAAHRFLLQLSEVAVVRFVILRMSRVSTVDATGARVLSDAITRLERRGIVVLMSGVSDSHHRVLMRAEPIDHLRRRGLVFADTPEAIAYAREQLRQEREAEEARTE